MVTLRGITYYTINRRQQDIYTTQNLVNSISGIYLGRQGLREEAQGHLTILSSTSELFLTSHLLDLLLFLLHYMRTESWLLLLVSGSVRVESVPGPSMVSLSQNCSSSAIPLQLGAEDAGKCASVVANLQLICSFATNSSRGI